MNIFRLLGDLSHLASFFFLIARLTEKRNAVGISLKTQELYLLVFVTRYLDLFTNFVSLYNSVMKLVYLGAAGWIVYMLRYQEPIRSTYEAALDTFMHVKFAVLPCAVLSLVVNEGSFWDQGVFEYAFEVLWAFSIYLEAIAIVPQLIMLQRHKAAENLTSKYMFALGAYRGLYVLNWIYRAMTESHYRSWIAWVAGVVQTAFYADFFYYFARSKWAGMKHVILPA
jgi:ER lumen protein retaining receptor